MCDTFLPTILDSKSTGNSSFATNLEKWFIFCIVWSIGGSISSNDRKNFDYLIRDIDSHHLPARSLYDYFINTNTNEFELWDSRLPRITCSSSSFHDIVVPTEGDLCNSFILESLIKGGHRTLITGTAGSGKTTLVKSVLGKLQGMSKVKLNLSSSIKSRDLQEIISERLEKHSKDKLGPTSGAERLLVFIDDLNLPKKTSDESPYQPPLELVRHLLGHGGWYHRKKCSWQQVVNTDILGALTPTSAGKTNVPARLQSQFHVMNCVEPNQKQVVSIFQSILVAGFGLGSVQSEIKSTFEAISNSTFQVFERSKKTFLPIPGKAHYNFTLHDVFKVAQGMLLAGNIPIESKESLCCLWIHECMRNFSDRFKLDDSKDESRFFEVLVQSLEQNLQCDIRSLTQQTTCISIIGPVFTSIQSVMNQESKNVYAQIRNNNDLFTSVNQSLEDYNENGNFVPMCLVLFDDALKHVCRIVRLLQLKRGHMVFIGTGGSGRESLTRLSAFIANIQVFTVEVTSKYKREDFREDLKALCMKCGADNQKTLFLLKDKHLKQDSFMEDISNLMLSGEVPMLFSKDEISQICDDLKKESSTPSSDNDQQLWDYFLKRLQNNLHIVMALSPVGRCMQWLQLYPAVSRCSTINWFNNWPTDALEQVAYHKLSQSDVEKGLKKLISEVFAFVHSKALQISSEMDMISRRINYVTPTHYLELISSFQKILQAKGNDLEQHERKLSSGLQKLQDGKLQVEDMKLFLKQKQLIVQKSQEDCEAMLERIVYEKRAAEQQRMTVMQDSERIAQEEKQCKVFASEAEADLAIALPALESALEQVQKLDKAAITEIKAYPKPPPAVERVLSCVMILFGKQTDWATAKRVLGDTNFLADLKSFDKDNVKETTMAKISKFIKSPSFAADEVTKVSRAAGALCGWCHAIHIYAGVAKEVAPKRAKLKMAQQSLEQKQNDLYLAQIELETATKKLAELREQYESSVSEKNELQSESIILEEKLSRAEKLIDGLSGEFTRWTTTIEGIINQTKAMIGDSILSSAFLSYSGPFDSHYRSLLIEMWSTYVKSKGVKVSCELEISKFLSTSMNIREWNLQGLPRDDFSAENAIIVTKSSRWPLLIDPQGQGKSWVKNMEGDTIKLIDIQSKDVMRDLELAISFGLPAMLINVKETLDGSLQSILSKSIYKSRGGELVICLGEKEIRYNEGFRLYITTSLPNPHFTPEISSATSIVNFAITKLGLEEQLLAIVVNEEEPELEMKKNGIVTKIADGKRKLVELEDSILMLLSDSSGNLVDDTALINALQSSKTTSEDVTLQLEVAKETEAKIDFARELFRGAARRSSIVFFTLKELSAVDPMYQFSLDSYLFRFKSNIVYSRNNGKTDLSKPIDENRVETINRHHTLDVFESTSIGLFRKHKTLFAMQLCICIMRDEGKISDREFEFFCQGKISTQQRKKNDNENFLWLNEKVRDSIFYLDVLIEGFIDGMKDQEQEWISWFNSERPEDTPLPGKWQTNLSGLQKLCVLRTLRLDRIPSAVSTFIATNIGKEYFAPPDLNLTKIVGKASSKTPLIFILTPGVDPSNQIATLAEKSCFKFVQVALGQGQAPVALNAIHKSSREGSWVLLANCHLMLDWMDELESVITNISDLSCTHEGFRLWLTSAPTCHFPLSFLQKGIKMTTEPPQGLVSTSTLQYIMK